MTLDDTFERLIAFRQDLISFRERMSGALAELSQRHASLDAIWRDSFRQEYDRAWSPLRTTLEDFHLRESPSYLAFLDDKIARLEHYLHGR